MAKGSSKNSPKGSAKGSPGKKSKSDKKSSPKDKKGSKKSPKSDTVPAPVVTLKSRKYYGTQVLWMDYGFINYRCPTCFIVIDSFQQFIDHECWRTYFLGRFHLGETQAYGCRTCERGFQTQISYSKHKCDVSTPEDTFAINYRCHFKYYMHWDKRIHQESIPYDTDWQFVCRCIKCGNKFKRIILYILHTCFQYSLLKPIEVKCLKICRYCKFVFVNEAQYDVHYAYCRRKDRAFCNNFMNTSFLRTVQQFVLGRHCYDFDLHITNKPLECSAITKRPVPVGCDVCGLIQESVLEFLFHPCVAGKVIAPADLEMTLVCNNCRCLFLNYEGCEHHLKYCLATSFTFLRFNMAELTVAIERWVTDVLLNPYLPKRPMKMKCQFCLEIFCDLSCFFKHLCPRKRRCEQQLIQPISLSEMYVCESCNNFYFTATEAVNHAENCPAKPLMIQIHPNFAECLAALEVWSKLPRLLQMEIYIGMPEIHEKCSKSKYEVFGKSVIDCPEECLDHTTDLKT